MTFTPCFSISSEKKSKWDSLKQSASLQNGYLPNADRDTNSHHTVCEQPPPPKKQNKKRIPKSLKDTLKMVCSSSRGGVLKKTRQNHNILSLCVMQVSLYNYTSCVTPQRVQWENATKQTTREGSWSSLFEVCCDFLHLGRMDAGDTPGQSAVKERRQVFLAHPGQFRQRDLWHLLHHVPVRKNRNVMRVSAGDVTHQYRCADTHS